MLVMNTKIITNQPGRTNEAGQDALRANDTMLFNALGSSNRSDINSLNNNAFDQSASGTIDDAFNKLEGIDLSQYDPDPGDPGDSGTINSKLLGNTNRMNQVEFAQHVGRALSYANELVKVAWIISNRGYGLTQYENMQYMNRIKDFINPFAKILRALNYDVPQNPKPAQSNRYTGNIVNWLGMIASRDLVHADGNLNNIIDPNDMALAFLA